MEDILMDRHAVVPLTQKSFLYNCTYFCFYVLVSLSQILCSTYKNNKHGISSGTSYDNAIHQVPSEEKGRTCCIKMFCTRPLRNTFFRVYCASANKINTLPYHLTEISLFVVALVGFILEDGFLFLLYQLQPTKVQ